MERNDFLEFDSSSSTKEPLLVIRLKNSTKVKELLKRTSFYSATIPLLIDAPMDPEINYKENSTIPFFCWRQEVKETKEQKFMAKVILSKVALDEDIDEDL